MRGLFCCLRSLSSSVQVAVVESHEASEKDVEFLKNIASNRGRPIQFFDNPQDAKDWPGIE